MNVAVINRARIRGGKPRVSGIKVMSSRVRENDVRKSKVLGIILTAFAISLLLTVSVACVYKGYRYLLTSPYFEISEVKIEGNKTLKDKEILRFAGNIIHQNIFSIDLIAVYTRLKRNHWINDAVVERELPNSIVIMIEERVPFAFASLSGGADTYLIDDNGIVLKKIENGTSDVLEGDYSFLPLITVKGIKSPLPGNRIRSEGLSTGLNVLRHVQGSTFLKDEGIKGIDITPGKGVTIFTEGDDVDDPTSVGIEIRVSVYNDFVGETEIEKRFSYLDTVLGFLDGEGREVRYVDLSFEDKVVVN